MQIYARRHVSIYFLEANTIKRICQTTSTYESANTVHGVRVSLRLRMGIRIDIEFAIASEDHLRFGRQIEKTPLHPRLFIQRPASLRFSRQIKKTSLS